MSIFGKRKPAQGMPPRKIASSELIDLSLPDTQWFAASEQIYDRTWRNHTGSPETFAGAGEDHYGNQNFAVALLFYRKAIDLLHTLYISSGMSTRQPSVKDLALIDGFRSSLAVTLDTHPAAPVAESVREVTHRLRTISSACKRAGLPADLYLNALQEIGTASPGVNVDDILW